MAALLLLPLRRDEARTFLTGARRRKLWLRVGGRSYGLLLGLGEWCTTRRDLSAHSVGVPLTAAAGSPEAVVALLAQTEASPGRQVAAQAREEEGDEAHGCPADEARAGPAGAGLVGAVVFVVGGAVVEEALHAAEASAVVEEALGGAKATLVAQPAGGEGTSRCAEDAFAAPTLLANEEVLPGVPRGVLSFCLQSTVELRVGPRSGLRSHGGLA